MLNRHNPTTADVSSAIKLGKTNERKQAMNSMGVHNSHIQDGSNLEGVVRDTRAKELLPFHSSVLCHVMLA